VDVVLTAMGSRVDEAEFGADRIHTIASRVSPDMRTYLPVDDPRRPTVSRAVGTVLVAAFVFLVFQLPVKQFLGLYDHVPWSDDPYDAVTSFAVFFVPLLALVCLVRIALFRRTEPLAVERVVGVLRASRLALGTMIVTLLSDWTSVALQANRAAWIAGTGVMIAVIAVLSVVVAYGSLRVFRAGRSIPHVSDDPPPVTDWLSDVLLLAERCTRWLGPLSRFAHEVIAWLDRTVVTPIRRFPIAAAAGAALAFGVLLAFNTLLREGAGPALWIDVVVGSTGMFAFLVAAGAYVGLVRTERPANGVRRRAVDAAVIGCLAVPVALGFREWLWWVIGTDTGDPQRLAELLAVAAVVTAVVVFAGETALRVHPGRTRATDRG
jgi:hypothetical protein